MTEAIGDMSASTDQKVLQIVESLRSRGEFLEEGYGLDIDKTVEFVKSAITQAIAVETAVLVEDAYHEGWMNRNDYGTERIGENALNWDWTHSRAKAILSATDSPGAKAEDTASAEFYKKALKEAKSLARLRVSSRGDGAGGTEIIILADAAVVHERSVPTLSTYLRTKEQP